MRASYKCENCGSETTISGEGRRHLGCQSCGCKDIKFDSDVTLSPVSDKTPGKVFPSVVIKKGEGFLGSHSDGSSWILTFPPPTPSEGIVLEPIKRRRSR